MGAENFLGILLKWKEQYRCLLNEAADLLRNIDIYSPEDLSKSITRRQEYLAEIHKINTYLDKYSNDEASGRKKSFRQALAEFRIFQDVTTRKILEFDSVAIALAGERIKSLKVEMAELARGKVALSGYDRSDNHRSAHYINNIA